MRKNTIARKPFVCTCPNGIYPLQKENSRSQTCLYLSKFFRFLRDTAVSAFNSFGSIRVCAAEPRPDFRYRSNANDGKAWLCRVLPRELAPKRKQQVSNLLFSFWSGKRDSNSRHLPWQGNALPLSHSRILVGTIGLEPMTPCL